MKWYNYIASFFAGIFLANVIPHYVNGVSGNGFPTPFASPPGLGLSSPVVNVLWALLNLVIGYFLFKAGKVSGNKWAVLIFFIGIAQSFYLTLRYRQNLELNPIHLKCLFFPLLQRANKPLPPIPDFAGNSRFSDLVTYTLRHSGNGQTSPSSNLTLSHRSPFSCSIYPK
jgi:hypothetical protein